ncbi:MAG: carbamoyl phosphate synthase small subunit [Candidatus Rokubacteria bacterium]|nr:carbamoyl phosphate synthase small subunit [Candidatus Rokubacteria bacterium]
MKKPALLALADGRVFRGESLGAEGEATGEVVFNTAMTGYQEIMTDPSYKGQIVVMTYPLIGNYGINDDTGIDCYGLHVGSGHIDGDGMAGRDGHAIRNGRHTVDPERLAAKAQASPGLIARDLVREVTIRAPHGWDEATWDRVRGYREPPAPRFTVVAFDSGIKRNILRQLVSVGCKVTVVPAFTPTAAVLEQKPDGVFLSNGPGDPEGVPYLIEAVRGLLGKVPIFGICLGHQIIGLAAGGRTYKLKFGHHGANHPVKDLATGKVEITAQNHGFAVDPDSVKARGLELSHVNLNDGTCEGLRHRDLPVFSVQYHPEASPGPHDANYLFHRFADLIERAKGG